MGECKFEALRGWKRLVQCKVRLQTRRRMASQRLGSHLAKCLCSTLFRQMTLAFEAARDAKAQGLGAAYDSSSIEGQRVPGKQTKEDILHSQCGCEEEEEEPTPLGMLRTWRIAHEILLNDELTTDDINRILPDGHCKKPPSPMGKMMHKMMLKQRQIKLQQAILAITSQATSSEDVSENDRAELEQASALLKEFIGQLNDAVRAFRWKQQYPAYDYLYRGSARAGVEALDGQLLLQMLSQRAFFVQDAVALFDGLVEVVDGAIIARHARWAAWSSEARKSLLTLLEEAPQADLEGGDTPPGDASQACFVQSFVSILSGMLEELKCLRSHEMTVHMKMRMPLLRAKAIEQARSAIGGLICCGGVPLDDMVDWLDGSLTALSAVGEHSTMEIFQHALLLLLDPTQDGSLAPPSPPALLRFEEDRLERFQHRLRAAAGKAAAWRSILQWLKIRGVTLERKTLNQLEGMLGAIHPPGASTLRRRHAEQAVGDLVDHLEDIVGLRQLQGGPQLHQDSPDDGRAARVNAARSSCTGGDSLSGPPPGPGSPGSPGSPSSSRRLLMLLKQCLCEGSAALSVLFVKRAVQAVTTAVRLTPLEGPSAAQAAKQGGLEISAEEVGLIAKDVARFSQQLYLVYGPLLTQIVASSQATTR